ncbi:MULTISPECIES: hypothetical protein [unclassified Carboxylicivirga]|uniref:hypothetical protein n=1 Tax=Carboxylicivirga TaxID=1628153 RepID=UPI003D34A9A2
MNIYKFFSVVYYLGMALVFLGVLMHISDIYYGAWVFAGGSLIMLGIRAYNRAVCHDINKRVNTILLYSAAMLLPASWAMLTGRRYWILFILLTAVLDSYASFRRIKK